MFGLIVASKMKDITWPPYKYKHKFYLQGVEAPLQELLSQDALW